VNSRWALAKRPPPRWPDETTFALKEPPVPTPDQGQALTRTIYVSLDPYRWGYKRRGEEPEGTRCHARTVSQVVEAGSTASRREISYSTPSAFEAYFRRRWTEGCTMFVPFWRKFANLAS
jgi:NADPH-dependent curcumin reductase CurA